MRSYVWKVVFVVAVVSVGTFHGVSQAGKLTPPPGPVGSTMVTMIRASDLPLTISASGAYAIETDIDASRGPGTTGGISIEASHVTLDLRGHSLRNGTGDGIAATVAVSDITIKNGTVSGWEDEGIDLTNATNSIVADLRVEANGMDGIRLGAGSAVLDSVAANNGQDGIALVRDGATASRCSASDNARDGFASSYQGHSVSHCTATGNGRRGFYLNGGVSISASSALENLSDGILVGTDSIVAHCLANNNGIPVGGDGIACISCEVVDCEVANNETSGIAVGANSYVARNNARHNFNGIYVNCGGEQECSTRIDSNNANNQPFGIVVLGAGSLVVRNSALANSTNYSIDPGNMVGTISTTPVGAGAWDNF